MDLLIWLIIIFFTLLIITLLFYFFHSRSISRKIARQEVVLNIMLSDRVHNHQLYDSSTIL